MSIPFTQYMRPDGRPVHVTIDMPEEVEAVAQEFINYGGWFECEHLATGHASLTACWHMPDGDNDIAIRVVPNGPKVLEAVEDIVRKAMDKYNAGELPIPGELEDC